MPENKRTHHSYLTRIRDVTLLPDEKVTHIFSPVEGLIDEPWRDGQLLITTNQRIMSFSQEEGSKETFLVPAEELKGVVVKASGGRNSGSLLQGLLLIVGAIIIYLVLSYWVTRVFDGPNIPIINLDLAPLLILLFIVLAGWLVVKHYFTPGNGVVIFQGSNWSFNFSFSGPKPGEDIYQLVNTTFLTRRSANGYHHPSD